MGKYKQFAIEFIPLLIGFFLQPLVHEEYLFLVIIVAVIIATWEIKYYKGEWKLLVLGIVFSFIFEGLSGQIYRMQYWQNASLLGIPIWLPLFWGYGFIFVYRLGKVLLEKN